MKLTNHGVFLCGGVPQSSASIRPEDGRRLTMAYRILQAHNQSGDEKKLRIRFDAMLSHDITYVGIIQQARASGMREFPIPYALTNCHNSLCAVGFAYGLPRSFAKAAGSSNAPKRAYKLFSPYFLNIVGKSR